MRSIFGGSKDHGNEERLLEVILEERARRIESVESAVKGLDSRVDMTERTITVLVEHVKRCDARGVQAAADRKRLTTELRGYFFAMLLAIIGAVVALLQHAG